MQDYQSAGSSFNRSQGYYSGNHNQVRRINRRQRMLRRRRMLLGGAVLLLTALIISIVLAFKGCSALQKDVLAGVWDVDGITTYEFDGKGSGAMVLPSLCFDFNYTINGDELVIDFTSDELYDRTYIISVKDDILTMTDREGTIGGVCELTKQKH